MLLTNIETTFDRIQELLTKINKIKMRGFTYNYLPQNYRNMHEMFYNYEKRVIIDKINKIECQVITAKMLSRIFEKQKVKNYKALKALEIESKALLNEIRYVCISVFDTKDLERNIQSNELLKELDNTIIKLQELLKELETDNIETEKLFKELETDNIETEKLFKELEADNIKVRYEKNIILTHVY
jgi:hypothetical protein